MWPRVAELMLALWLAASPFTLRVSDLGSLGAIHTFACALLVVVASCLAYWEATPHARAMTAFVGLWMATRAYVVAPRPAPPVLQSEFLIGLLFFMLAIVPNDAAEPPRAWRRFIIRRKRWGQSASR